jgi:glycosyltransferase involved in cell wall biosynthesis
MNNKQLNISIGILAYNESAVIRKTLQSLFEQSLFKNPYPSLRIEVIVVANGCTDDTAAIAKTTLNELVNSSLNPYISFRICEVRQAGLANAWNVYIHKFSQSNADYLFVMSADIEFLKSQTLFSMIRVLETRSEALVSVDRRIKDIVLKKNKSLIEKLSVTVSGLSGGNNAVEGSAAWISGQLYCSRADILRQICLPTTLPTDDAFIYTMIVTNCLQEQQEPNKVILAGSASHIFEAYTSIGRLLRHEKWLIFGQTINELLYADLLVNRGERENICLLIKQRNEQDPIWLNKLVQTAIDKKEGSWLIPRFILTRRFESLFNKSLIKAILLFPFAFTVFILDLWLSIQVNFELQENKGINYWTGSGSWGKLE